MSKQKTERVEKLSEEKLLNKIEQSPLFLGFYLKKYLLLERLSLKQMHKLLGLDEVRYKKLEFYKIESQRVVEVCDSASEELNFKSESLLAVIRHVLAFEKMGSLPAAPAETPGFLMAARKKVKKK